MTIKKYTKAFLLTLFAVLLLFGGMANATQHDMDVSVDDANTGTTFRAGFNAAILDDAGGGANVWYITTDGTDWQYVLLTKAV